MRKIKTPQSSVYSLQSSVYSLQSSVSIPKIFLIFAQKLLDMKIFILRIFAFAVIGLLLTSCKGKNGGYQEHPSGLRYKFIEMNPKGESPKVGDILHLSIRFVTEAGLLVDESSSYRLQLARPLFQGDFFTGLGMLQVGDSIHFLLDAFDYYKVTRKRDLPDEFVAGDKLIIQLKLKGIVSIESLEKERAGIYHTGEDQEMNLLRAYLEKTNVTADPTESGMYVIIIEEGSGPLVLPGQTLTVHYTGKTIDGKVFDSSLTRGNPLTFTLGRGEVIKGWDEGFAKLRKGSRARFIIPSKLAYGEKGFGQVILPYSTLVFDVELLGFK